MVCYSTLLPSCFVNTMKYRSPPWLQLFALKIKITYFRRCFTCTVVQISPSIDIIKSLFKSAFLGLEDIIAVYKQKLFLKAFCDAIHKQFKFQKNLKSLDFDSPLLQTSIVGVLYSKGHYGRIALFRCLIYSINLLIL